VVDPRGFIENCARMLRPGGSLVLCVPNAESYLSEIPVLLDMPPHHMLRWSQRAFAALSTLMPLDLTAVRFEPLRATHVSGYVAASRVAWKRNHPSLGWVFNRGTQALGSLFLRAGLRHLARGQSLYVILRRRG
jgi:hypothetical protein